jgi:hypothetical protein
VGLRSMVVIEGSDRSTEAKRETETEGCSGTIATLGAIKFKGIVHFFETRSSHDFSHVNKVMNFDDQGHL